MENYLNVIKIYILFIQGILKTSTKNLMKIPTWEGTTAVTKMAQNGQSPFPQISAHYGMILLLLFFHQKYIQFAILFTKN